MKSNKGFTLIEIAVVLAIIAILAAILTPIVTSYIDQARITRANSDTKKIAEGILLFKRDTGVFPPYNSLAAAKSGTNPDVECLVSGSGAGGFAYTTTSATVGTFTCATTGTLANYLNVNSLGVTTATESAAIGGITNFRGPYLDGLNGADPWANPYVVNSKNLGIASVNYAYAVSGGPNGAIDTIMDQARSGKFTIGDDDIAALIR